MILYGKSIEDRLGDEKAGRDDELHLSEASGRFKNKIFNDMVIEHDGDSYLQLFSITSRLGMGCGLMNTFVIRTGQCEARLGGRDVTGDSRGRKNVGIGNVRRLLLCTRSSSSGGDGDRGRFNSMKKA